METVRKIAIGIYLVFLIGYMGCNERSDKRSFFHSGRSNLEDICVFKSLIESDTIHSYRATVTSWRSIGTFPFEKVTFILEFRLNKLILADSNKKNTCVLFYDLSRLGFEKNVKLGSQGITIDRIIFSDGLAVVKLCLHSFVDHDLGKADEVLYINLYDGVTASYIGGYKVDGVTEIVQKYRGRYYPYSGNYKMFHGLLL